MAELTRQAIIGKCEEELFKLPAESVHLVCTSPPYNVGIAYDTHDDNMTEQAYYEWVEKWIKGCHHVLVEGGRIAINLPNVGNNNQGKGLGLQTYVDKYIPILKKAGFTLRENITWIKSNAEFDENNFCGNNTAWGSYLSPNNPMCRSFSEVILVAHKGRPDRGRTGKNDLIPAEFLKYTRNVWFMPAENDRSHPAPYPEELPARLIKLYTWRGETVLDPFGGSGSTGVAAERLGRGWILIDVSENYMKLAQQRINDIKLASDDPSRPAYQSRLEGFAG